MPKFNQVLLWPIFPFLFSAFPILFIFSQNSREVLVEVVFKPLALFTLATGLLLTMGRLIFGNWEKAGLMAAILVWLFFLQGRFHSFLGEGGLPLPGFKLGTDEFIFVVYFGILLLLFIPLWRTKREFSKAIQFLNFVGIFLFGLVIFNIAAYEIAVDRPLFYRSQNFTVGEGQDENPDIYYLIFDGYGRNQALKDYWGYDNSEFTDFLVEKGFYVAYDSTANYAKTSLSLASSLNLTYLDDLTTNFSGADETLIYPLIENNKVVEFLKEKGYRYYNIGSWFEGTKINVNADKNFNLESLYLGGFFDDFTLQVLSTTSLAPVMRRLFPETNILDFVTQHRARILYQFDNLQEIPYLPGPKYVFVHILSPHQPFVFSENCGSVPRDQADVVTQDNFIGQLKCTNQKIKETVNTLLEDERPKVIILQADEGIRHPRQRKFDSTGNLTTKWLNERFGILNSYYVSSGILQPGFYHDITPVNTFRKIFNLVFNEKFDILPDLNFMHANKFIYGFVDVTDKLR